MKSITDTLADYEDIFREHLKVKNPALLKTGALGTLVNIFTNIKYDTAVYYNKLLRELNPSTATEFNSLLFHSSILNYNITFGTPATMQISFVLPEYRLRSSEIVTYEIGRDTKFVDGSGLEYTLEEDIKIQIDSSNISAKRYSNVDINILETSRIENPLNPSTNIFMVEYEGLRQYARQFYKFNIPFYEVGEQFTFSIDIPTKDDIYEITAWIRRDAHLTDELDLDILYRKDTINIKEYLDFSQLKIKYNKFNANQFDNNLYLKISENQLIFNVGDGINGLKLNEGDQVIIETKLTKGEGGNVPNAEINLEDIILVSEDKGGYKTSSKTNIKVLSLSGGELGSNIEDIEHIKSEMIKKNSVKNSITSVSDFEIMYSIDGGKPFVDPKFFNSQNHIFIYNIIRDKNQRIVPTTTFNINDDEFKNNLFMPTKVYNDLTLISPFYYKKKYNHYDAYMVVPEITIGLNTRSEIDKLTKLKNSIGLYITYDYFERKSRIEIKNYNPEYVYKIKTNLFDMTLSIDNDFQLIINQRFLDEFCILTDNLKDIRVEILSNGFKVLDLYSSGTYSQLVLKQAHYYFTKLNLLDQTKETRIVLHLPYIDLEYMKSERIPKLFTKLNRFFRVQVDKDDISFNVGVTQSFYNTIKIEKKYKEFIIENNSNGDILTTRNIIIIDLIIDKHDFALSDYTSTEELEYDMKSTIYKTLRTAEGFETEFYETLLEREMVTKYPMLKNVDVISPKVFSTYDTRTIYDKMDNALQRIDFNMFDIVDFIPPYFFFDYDSINLNIVLN